MAGPSLRYLSAFNGYVPRATGIVVGEIRNPDKFPLNRYIQYVSTKAKVFLWTQLSRDQPARIVSDAEFAWEDGDDRPRGRYNQLSFVMQEGRTFRRNYPWTLGYDAIEQASDNGTWDPEPVHMQSCISQSMTNRTNKVYSLISSTANWGTSTASANTLNGGAGNWLNASDDPASPNYLAIFKSLQAAQRFIRLQTNACVDHSMLRCVIGPDLAIAMSETAEIVNYMRESPAARDIVENGLDPQYENWGLPKRYKGFEFVVDDTTIVTQRPSTATSYAQVASGNLQPPEASVVTPPTLGRSFIWQPNIAVMMSRQGSLDGKYGSESYSTVQLYHHNELAQVEIFNDPENRRVNGNVVEDYSVEMVSNVSGFLITGTNS